MAKKTMSLYEFQKIRKEQLKEQRVKARDNKKMIQECFRNVRKANTSGKLTYCY